MNLGKPDPEMITTVLGLLGLAASDCVMVGDRLTTDIVMANRAGLDSALVLTGETTPELLVQLGHGDHRPTYVLHSIAELLAPV